MKNKKGDYFVRGDVQNKYVIVGCNHALKDDKHFHSYELHYDHEKSLDGIKSYPVMLRWVGQYQLTDNITWKTKMDIGKEVIVQDAWIQKINDKWSISASDHVNLTNLIYEPRNSNVHLGLQVNLSL